MIYTTSVTPDKQMTRGFITSIKISQVANAFPLTLGTSTLWLCPLGACTAISVRTLGLVCAMVWVRTPILAWVAALWRAWIDLRDMCALLWQNRNYRVIWFNVWLY